MTKSSGGFPLRSGLAGLVFVFAVNSAAADEIMLKNGDKITGKIESAAGGKLTITPAFDASTQITVPLAQVATFSSDQPLTLVLDDGTVIKQSVAQAQTGQVTTVANGPIVPQPVAVGAISKINPPPVAWTGSVTANGLFTQTTARNIGFGISTDDVRRSDTDRITFDAAYQYAEQKASGVTSTTANNWFLQGEYDDFFSPQFFGYASGRVEQDHVNFLRLRLLPSAGVGYQWVEEPDFNFETKGGLAWQYEDYSTLSSSRDSVSLGLSYHLDRTVLDGKVKLFNDVALYPSLQELKDFLALVDGGARFALTKTMYSQISVNMNYDNNPAPGARQTTTQFLFGLGLTY